MIGNKKWALLAILALAVFLTLSGCNSDLLPRVRDITQVKLMRTIALDPGEEGRVKITVSGNTQKEGDDGQTQPPLILSQEALTVFGGCLSLQRDSDGYVEFGHLTECVLGEELARQGIEGITDFIERDFAMRLETKLFLVEGAAGEEAVNGTASKSTALTDRLTAISQDRSLGGPDWPYTLRELLSQLQDNGSGLMPVITLEDNPEYDPESQGETPEKEVHLKGLAFFSEYKLGDILSPEESRGTALLTEQDQLDSVEVELDNGTTAGLQLVNSWCRLEPVFDGTGRLTGVTARIGAIGELCELKGWADPMEETVIAELEEKFAQALQADAQAALDRSQEEGVDFLHLRRQLITKCALRAPDIRDNWEDWFSQLELKAVVEGRVERSYDVNRPMAKEEQ